MMTIDITTVAPEESAAEAGLRYVHVDRPGYTRHRSGKGVYYRDTKGNRITDPRTISRITSLAIPPAWTDVWICPSPVGHIQATGRDAKKRKQYRYHPRWRTVRDAAKYEHMLAFGKKLPAIRERTAQDLRKHGLPKNKLLAAIVHLLETTLIRVGNEAYVRDNKSFGLTTMQNQHASANNSSITFVFRGKSGIEHEIDIHDRRMATIVRRSQELPGQELFQYVDDDGQPQAISSDDVNTYLKEISGEDFTAKDFRTWAGTLLAAEALAALGQADSESEAKHNIVQAIEQVSSRLGNTPAVCRKCYIHPAIIEAYLNGQTITTVQDRSRKSIEEHTNALSPEEDAMLTLLCTR